MSEMPDVFDEVVRKSRKTFSCSECRGIVVPGENYHEINGLWDGSWSRYKICPECYDLREKVDTEIRRKEGFHWEPLYFGELLEAVAEWRDREFAFGLLDEFMTNRLKRNAPPTHKGWLEDQWEKEKAERT